ncbi:MAG: hypothetical protein HUU60_04810 [Armatimonadetes bacterium]|nr:hypothetical protein [Armatimonadota bacterium]
MEQPKRPNRTVACIVVLGALAGMVGSWMLLAFLSAQILSRAQEKAPPDSMQCVINLRALYSAAQLYAQENDGRLPLADSWSDALIDKGADKTAFECPRLRASSYGYAMNSDLSGQKLSEIENRKRTVLFFESSLARRNAHDKVESLPKPSRHRGGNLVIYADGRTSEILDQTQGRRR